MSAPDDAYDARHMRPPRDRSNVEREAYIRSIVESLPIPSDEVLNRLVVLMTRPRRAPSDRRLNGDTS